MPKGACIHHLFEARAGEDPSRVALVAEDASLTYGELESRANRLAHHLVGRGVGAETLVGVCLPRTTDMVVAVLGILKAGGAYLPLDPDLPSERLDYLLEDGGAAVLVTLSDLLASIPSFAGYAMCLDRERDTLASSSDLPPDAVTDLDTLAYVIYTSGSTGRPKGVEVCHGSVVNLLAAFEDRLHLSAEDVVLAPNPLSFDPSVVKILGTLGVGACVVLTPEGAAADGELLRSWMERTGTTLAGLGPSTWRTLLAAGWTGGANLRAFVGSEAVPLDLAQELVARCGVVWNVYGPTETTVAATAWRIPGDVDRIRIGTPLANYTAHVLDARMEPVPAGAPGEIYIGGPSVARGYRNRPELTSERFVPDPFSTREGGRLYRTGDRARWCDDGQLEFLGRLDRQVKVRGVRIELGEVEAVLVEHGAVREAAVRVDGAGVDARLVAYVALEASRRLDDRELRRFLRRTLPDAMVPSVYMELERLPRTLSGKVDPRALPEPPRVLPSDHEAYVAPRTSLEATLVRIWADVLGRERVGVHDDFFALGGHSILATRVVSRVARDLGIELFLRSVFDGPTVAELAARVEAPALVASIHAPPIERSPPGEPRALSFAQRRLWFLDRIGQGGELYNLPLTLELSGRLERDVLHRSIDALVTRHEALRTTFPDRDGIPWQAVASGPPGTAWEWQETDLAASGRAGDLDEHLRREAWRPFDLAVGPLFRVGLFRRGGDDHVLQLVMHHTVADGWSAEVIRRELGALYAAFLAGEASPLASLPIQYVDYAAWQHESLRGEALEAQLLYWREQLMGLTSLELPKDRPRRPVQSFRGAGRRLRLGAHLADRLRVLSRGEGATLFMTLMAAFQLLLHRTSGQTDIAVGTPIAGRSRSELEGLIGMFVNTLVLRSDLSGDPSFRELLRQVRTATLEAHAHQDLPFEKLVEVLQPQRDQSRNPLFQVMFALQNAPRVRTTMPGLEVRTRDVESERSRLDLALSLRETAEAGQAGAIEGTWTYATDLFDQATIDRMRRHFEVLLEGIVADPDAPVGRLALMAEDERRALVEQQNDTKREVLAGACVHHLFEACVGEYGDRVALVAEDGSPTYGELESKANRLARHLVDRGVEAETLVGVSLPRTTDMVVAVLAIWKAGGAYLPLDPDLPPERLGYLLEDGGVALLVTHSELLDSFPSFAGDVVCLDREAGALSTLSDARPEVVAYPDQLAYVIYTSGSTGRPKGVEIRHGSAVNFIAAMGERLRFSTEDVLLAIAPLSFDPSVVQIFGPLSVGARVVLAPAGVAGDGERLRSWMEGSGVTLAGFAPSIWRTLLEAGWPGDPGLRAFMGGEALPLDLARKLVARCGEVWNMYGPTEATIGATAWRVPTDVDQIRIGTPLGNYRVYVLDSWMEPVPVGVPGELYVGGVGVARGYRDRPELTAERFVPDPFTPGEGRRLYRTGDRARYRDDGTLEFQGRLDDQVKIRGFRIELGEIEAVLAEHEAIRQAAVGVHGEGVDARLVAYPVFESGEGLTSTEVRRYLRRTLPEYMVPSLVVELADLPRTTTGKIDRESLPDPLSGEGGRGVGYDPPQTAEERLIGDVWRDLLEIDRIDRTDNFYEIGGHSLLSIRAIAAVEKLTGRRLDPRAMFFQTVEELARTLGDEPGDGVRPAEHGLGCSERRPPRAPAVHEDPVRDKPGVPSFTSRLLDRIRASVRKPPRS